MSVANETAKQKALDTLTHYIKLGYEAAGKEWQDDMTLEFQDALTDLVEAVVEQELEYARSKMKDQDELSIEDVDTLYQFLAKGTTPEGVTVNRPPKLGHKRAFSVIWFMQEVLHIIPDHYERCDNCDGLLDDHSEGHYDEKTGKHFHEACL